MFCFTLFVFVNVFRSFWQVRLRVFLNIGKGGDVSLMIVGFTLQFGSGSGEERAFITKIKEEERLFSLSLSLFCVCVRV